MHYARCAIDQKKGPSTRIVQVSAVLCFFLKTNQRAASRVSSDGACPAASADGSVTSVSSSWDGDVWVRENF